MNSNTAENKNVHDEANRLFAKSLLLVCLFIMAISAVARFFGILWFQADLESIVEPSETVQIGVFILLGMFELMFTHKILCRLDWKWCFLIALIQTILTGLISNLAANIVDIVFIVFVPVLFNYKNWKRSLFENIIFYLFILAYSATFLFGRVGLVYDAKSNFAVQILTIIDYKILFVAFYLVVKLFGGIKLWKNQKTPMYKTKDQSMM